MMRLFKDSEFRSRCLIYAALVFLVIGVCLTLGGIFWLGRDQVKLHQADAQLLFEANANKAWREAFRNANPEIPVPRVVDINGPSPDGKIIVVPAKALQPTPAPIATPTPIVKIKNRIRYRTRPTPTPNKPFWKR